MLRSLSDLPFTSVYGYEPEYPDAHLFSTVQLKCCVSIQGVYGILFNRSGWPGDSLHGIEIPETLGYLEASWSKRDISLEEPYNELFTTTMARIAEGMGAVYGTYGGDYYFEYDTPPFEEFWKIGHSYRFLSWPMVDFIGKDRLEELGDTVEVSNGVAIRFSDRCSTEIEEICRNIWEEMEILQSENDEPRKLIDEIEVEKQEIDKEYFIDTKKFDLHPYRKRPFFVCFIPYDNHSRDVYARVLGEMETQSRLDPNTSGTPADSINRANRLYDRYKISTVWFNLYTDKEAMQEHPWIAVPEVPWYSSIFKRKNIVEYDIFKTVIYLDIELISGIPNGLEADDQFSRPGMVTALITIGDLDYSSQALVFLKAIEMFSTGVGAAYGFGCLDSLAYYQAVRKDESPGNRLWPINYWRIVGSDDKRKQIVKDFYSQCPELWTIHSPDPSTVLLVYNDKRVEYSDLTDARARQLSRDLESIDPWV